MKQVQYINPNLFVPKSAWDRLSLKEKADVIRVGIDNGLSNVSDIKKKYNEFAGGGSKKRFSSLKDITKDWESDYPIKDVTDLMRQGPYYLYESQFDGIPIEADGRYYVVPNYYNLDDIDENSYRVLDYKKEFRPLLPKRDYIGGDNYRERIVDLIPGLADSIYSKAKAYGADPNVMMRRIMKEGFLDNRAKEYNELVNTPDQKDYWNHDNIWNREYNSAGEFGLDWVSKNIQDGLYELRNPEDTWMSAEGVNEKNQTVYPMVANLNTSLEALASDAAWRQGRIEKTKNPPKNELPFYVNASYNLDTEHKDLDNRPYILKTYSFDPYYDAQGKFIHKKDFGGSLAQTANKFGGGGNETTLEDYLQAKRDSVIASALQNSRTRTAPEITYYQDPLTDHDKKNMPKYIKGLEQQLQIIKSLNRYNTDYPKYYSNSNQTDKSNKIKEAVNYYTQKGDINDEADDEYTFYKNWYGIQSPIELDILKQTLTKKKKIILMI